LQGEQKFIEAEFQAQLDDQPSDFLERLDQLEERSNGIRVPAAFANLLCALKHHLTMVRQSISQTSKRAGYGPSPLFEEST
jgi:hypothetical protein